MQLLFVLSNIKLKIQTPELLRNNYDCRSKPLSEKTSPSSTESCLPYVNKHFPLLTPVMMVSKSERTFKHECELVN